jgi:hypothetical protein
VARSKVFFFYAWVSLFVSVDALTRRGRLSTLLPAHVTAQTCVSPIYQPLQKPGPCLLQRAVGLHARDEKTTIGARRSSEWTTRHPASSPRSSSSPWPSA